MTVPQEALTAIANGLAKFSITNPFIQTAILSSISSESSFVPKSEYSYKNTSNTRLREIFTTRLSGYTDAQLTELKKNDVAFYDAVYGYQTKLGRDNGNTTPGDGYKYRGRGFNQITFKNNYLFYGNKIGVDLVNNPDRLNEVPIAAMAAAAFYGNGLTTAAKNGLMYKKFKVSNANDVKDKDTAVKVVLQTNAGWGNDIGKGFLLTVFEKQLKEYDNLIGAIKNNPGTTLGGIATAVGLFFLVRYLVRKRKKK